MTLQSGKLLQPEPWTGKRTLLSKGGQKGKQSVEASLERIKASSLLGTKNGKMSWASHCVKYIWYTQLQCQVKRTFSFSANMMDLCHLSFRYYNFIFQIGMSNRQLVPPSPLCERQYGCMSWSHNITEVSWWGFFVVVGFFNYYYYLKKLWEIFW